MVVTRSSKRLLTQVVEVTEVSKAVSSTKKQRTKASKTEPSGGTNGKYTATTTNKIINNLKKVSSADSDGNIEVQIEIETTSTTTTEQKSYIAPFAKGLDFVVDIDPTLKSTIAQSVFPVFYSDALDGSPESPYHDNSQTCFAALARGIIGQQVSGAAARAILGRFKAAFDNATKDEIDTLVPEMYPTKKEFEQKKRELTEKGLALPFPEPSAVLEASDERLRAAGLSNRKVEYMKGLAEAFTDGTLSEEILKSSSDDEVVDKIVALKGFGRK